jgi:hypothetical protein
MKTLIVCASLLVCGSLYAGDCGTTACKSRSVTVTKEVVRTVVKPFKRKTNDCCSGGVCRSRSVTVVR